MCKMCSNVYTTVNTIDHTSQHFTKQVLYTQVMPVHKRLRVVLVEVYVQQFGFSATSAWHWIKIHSLLVRRLI